MQVVASRHKRYRSPSPPCAPDLDSPLDTLIKRRRREELSKTYDWDLSTPGASGSGHGHLPSNVQHEHQPEASTSWSQAGVEHRRQKQWERQQAPPVYYPSSSQPESNYYSERASASLSHTQYSSPVPRQYSQPDPPDVHHQSEPMSSSPIQHRAPTSSPFRSKGPRATGDRVEEEEDMEMLDEDQLRDEWGEVYASQNLLLHSLVSLARS
jgi:hypothetical protein